MGASEQPNDDAERGPEEDRIQWPSGRLPDGGQELPLYLRDRSDGQKGNAQDEKDEMEE